MRIERWRGFYNWQHRAPMEFSVVRSWIRVEGNVPTLSFFAYHVCPDSMALRRWRGDAPTVCTRRGSSRAGPGPIMGHVAAPPRRRAGRDLLSLALIAARNHTLRLLSLHEQAPEAAARAARAIAGGADDGVDPPL